MSVILSFFEAKERILQTPPRKLIRNMARHLFLSCFSVVRVRRQYDQSRYL